MRAWNEALSTVENLLKDMLQIVSDGAVSMTILAWYSHLDLIVPSGANAYIDSINPLGPFEGCLTLI